MTREHSCRLLDRSLSAINAVLKKYEGQAIITAVGHEPIDTKRVIEEAVEAVTNMGFNPSTFTHFNPDVSTMNHVRDLFLHPYMKDSDTLQKISEDRDVADHIVEKLAQESMGMSALAAYWHHIVSRCFDKVSVQVPYVCIGYDGKAYLIHAPTHRHPGGWAQSFRTKDQLEEMLHYQATILMDHHRAGVWKHNGIGYLEKTSVRTHSEYESLLQDLRALRKFLP